MIINQMFSSNFKQYIYNCWKYFFLNHVNMVELSCGCFDTLDVIVEGTVSIPVLVENPKGVAVGKILKLYQTVHPVPAGQQR